MNNKDISRILADGGFGGRLGDFRDKTILYGVDEGEKEFCVVIYWNDTETDEGVQVATVDNSHGQSVHVDKYRSGKKVSREFINSEVSTVYEAEQYVKDNWRELAKFHFEG